MSKIIISSKQVKAVRQDGIVYVDNNGAEQFIDFEVCYQNYLEPRLTPEWFKRYKELNPQTGDFEAYEARMKSWKEVARRNVLGDDFLDTQPQRYLPYLQFHTKPPLYLEFENEDEYHQLLYQIENVFHWNTFDMT